MNDQTETWAIVELMGHVRLAGRLSEEEKFGSKLGRLDIPNAPHKDCPLCKGSGQISSEDAGKRGLPLVDLIHGRCPEPSCNGFVTQYFGGASVYRITICTEATARQTATVKAAPVSAWELPRQLTRVRDEDEDDEDHPQREF